MLTMFTVMCCVVTNIITRKMCPCPCFLICVLKLIWIVCAWYAAVLVLNTVYFTQKILCPSSLGLNVFCDLCQLFSHKYTCSLSNVIHYHIYMSFAKNNCFDDL